MPTCGTEAEPEDLVSEASVPQEDDFDDFVLPPLVTLEELERSITQEPAQCDEREVDEATGRTCLHLLLANEAMDDDMLSLLLKCNHKQVALDRLLSTQRTMHVAACRTLHVARLTWFAALDTTSRREYLTVMAPRRSACSAGGTG